MPTAQRQSFFDSYYAATADSFPRCAPLAGMARADVGVVGGGYTGLSAALHLAEGGYRVALLEAENIGFGASGRNGGQLGSGLRKDQAQLEAMLGLAHARRLWEMAELAKAEVRRRIRVHRIGCDLKPGVLHASLKRRYLPAYRRNAEHLQGKYGYDKIRFVDRDEIAAMLGTAIYRGGTLDRGAGHLHPLNYALGLARAAVANGARIYEQSRVVDYRRGKTIRVRTAAGELHADALLLACNGYLGALEPRIAAHIMPINNFIAATAPLGRRRARGLIRDDVAVADSKFVVDYYRLSADHRLLFGGGENYTRRFPRDIRCFVRKPLHKVFPQLADVPLEYAWGGTLAVTVTRLPHFGRLEKNVFYAHGFSGQGLALATLAGKLLAEAAAGTLERFDVFATLPAPAFPGGRLLRWPGLVAGMVYYSLRDRL